MEKRKEHSKQKEEENKDVKDAKKDERRRKRTTKQNKRTAQSIMFTRTIKYSAMSSSGLLSLPFLVVISRETGGGGRGREGGGEVREF